MQRLIDLYRHLCGHTPEIAPLKGAGSNRKYYRLTGETTLIGVVGTSREENDAFCYLAAHLAAKGLPVPQVYARSADGLAYLQQDLGQRALFDALGEGRKKGGDYNAHEVALLERTIRVLPRLQVEGGEGLDFSRCYPSAQMDPTSVLFDLNYFKYCFLKTTGIDFNEYRLEADFQQMAADLGGADSHLFLYRDFQARNVMLDAEEQPWFIDFQGGREGAPQYDVASFLWQASARYPQALREHLIHIYIEALRELRPVDEAAFRQRLRLFVLFRLLQVLGAYGFRGLYERKRHFIDSIPPARANLREWLAEGACPYPYLGEVLTRLVADHDKPAAKADSRSLTVRVNSFSYKKGLPADPSGNGGGYVFDCRSTHNPGRYQAYKRLTGLDEAVIQFLEDDGEIATFLHSVYPLADHHVERFLERGFTHLMFSFGCKGGQHRSVYSAQHLAEHIHTKYGVRVELRHREQHITTTFGGVKAMVFAAGLGTRLRPLTDTMPKALVPVGGKPLLQIVLERLREAGLCEAVVNIHHFADMVEEWVGTQAPKGMHVALSDEREALLETGGAVKHAVPLLEEADSVVIHNVDILSNCRLAEFVAHMHATNAAALLLVSDRQTRRYLLFDDDMRLVGWTNTTTGEVRSPYPDLDPSRCRKLAFAGIHQMKTALFRHFGEWPARFSIIDFYLALCQSEPIYGYVQPDLRLMDVGKTDTLGEATHFIATINE